MIKYLFILFFFLSSYNVLAQYPTGFPSRFNTLWERIGYSQADSGTIVALRDTAWTPRFGGTIVLWRQASDTSYFFYTGQRWIKLLKEGDAANVFASNGLSKDGDTVELGGTLNQQTDIALNSNNLRLTGTGNLVVGDAGSSTARLQVNTGSFNGPPYLQVGPLLSNSIYANIHTSDTVTSSNVSSFPLRGLQMNRNIVMQDNNLTISDKEGALLGLVFRLQDSVRLNPLGSDLMYGVRGSINFGKYSGYSGRSIVQSGLFDFDASQGILGLIAAAGSGSNYFRLRGYYAGVTGYLIINSVDTVDNFMGFQSTGEVRGKLLKGYNFYGGGLQNCDTCYGVYMDDKGTGANVKYNFLYSPTGIGSGAEVPDAQLHVVGNSHFTDTGRLDARFSYNTNLGSTFTRYTLVDKNYTDSSLQLKLNISDTASMLSPYLRKTDTASLSNRIDFKLDSAHIYTASDPDPDTLYQYVEGDSTLVGLLPKGGGGGADSAFIIDSVIKRFGLDTNFLKNPEIDIYFGVLRPVSSQVNGTDIIWDWIDDGAHTFYGFTNHIDETSGQIRVNYPKASVLYTFLASPDESLAQYGVTVGSKFTEEWANIWAYYPNGMLGGTFTGNGGASITQTNSSLSGWTTVYAPASSQLRFTFPSGYQNPQKEGCILTYDGTAGYKLERMTGGLAGSDIGWLVEDESGNLVVDTLQTTDKFSLLCPVMKNLLIQFATVGNTNNVIYDAGFKNYWVAAILKKDTLAPGTTNIITVDSTSVSGEITLDWNDVVKADNYEVQRSTHYNYGFSQVYSGSASTFTDSGLTPGTVYYYIIRGVNTAATPDRNGGWWKVRGGAAPAIPEPIP